MRTILAFALLLPVAVLAGGYGTPLMGSGDPNPYGRPLRIEPEQPTVQPYQSQTYPGYQSQDYGPYNSTRSLEDYRRRHPQEYDDYGRH